MWAVAVATAWLQPGIAGTLPAQEAGAGPDDTLVLVRPIRRVPDTPPTGPPELPSHAGALAPLTLDVVIARKRPRSGSRTVRQSVSRTTDRVHLAVRGREWLFERNVVDPRRVSGWLVDHPRRTIVLHEESELRNRLGLNGWSDILLLGLDSALVRALQPTNQSRMLGGLRFVKQVMVPRDAATSNVWFNREQALPAVFVNTDAAGSTRVSVERISPGVDADLLRPPPVRFPAYTVVDVAEWLERR